MIGKREAEINVAEGMKKARILNSEAFQREQINQATGEAEALVWKAKAQATSVEVLADAMSQQVIYLAPEIIKLFSSSSQLRLKLILLINFKMPTIVGILTFISRINYRLWSSRPSISIYLGYIGIYEQFKFHAQLS